MGKLVSSVDGDNVVYVGDGFEVTGLFIVNGIVGLKLQTWRTTSSPKTKVVKLKVTKR